MKLVLFSLFLAFSVVASAADFYETLVVGRDTYHNVYVLSANASSLSIKHQKGLSQVLLSELPSELQQKYGYSASEAADRKEQLAVTREQQAQAAQARLAQRARATREQSRNVASQNGAGLDSAFERFGTVPQIAEECDLRPRFRGHDIHVRQQRGPSCSVHAVVAALEYQFAENRGKRINFSENDLVAATAKTLGRATRNDFSDAAASRPVVEEGFALEHVFQAIRGHGLRLEHSAANQDQSALESEIRNVDFGAYLIPGDRSEVGIANIVHVLNAQMPVVVGVSWPSDGRVRNTSLLSKQPPLAGAGHAVTIVGYKCPTGKIEDTKFIFRNSWGVGWGAGGYGFFTYEYLANNLFNAYVVELK